MDGLPRAGWRLSANRRRLPAKPDTLELESALMGAATLSTVIPPGLLFVGQADQRSFIASSETKGE
jgi:hypothetical protein